MSDKVKVQAGIRRSDYDWLKLTAERDGTSLGDQIREAVRRYVDARRGVLGKPKDMGELKYDGLRADAARDNQLMDEIEEAIADV